MTEGAFCLEKCKKDCEKKIGNIVYNYLYYKDSEIASVKFPWIKDGCFDKINTFVFKLVKAYVDNQNINKCKTVEINLIFYNEKYLSMMLCVNFDNCVKNRSLNFDLKTMLPVSCSTFIRDFKIKKSRLKKIVKKTDKKMNVDYDTLHLFRGDIRFYARRQKEDNIIVFRIKIS